MKFLFLSLGGLLTIAAVTASISPSSIRSSSTDADRAIAVNRLPLPEEMSFEQKRAELLTYRSADQVCASDSGNCMAWTNLAMLCERSLAGHPVDYDKPCTGAEEFRERVTRIETSTEQGAYTF